MTPTDADHVAIFDTSLRDGEQSPGAAMTLEEKLGIARHLEDMNVDVIEAGFPSSSAGDFEAVQAVAKTVQNSIVAGLARALLDDVDRCGEALRHASRPRIHTFISTSPVHMKYKLQMEPSAVLEAVRASIERARRYTDDVEWGAEDATRAEPDFLARCVEQAIRSGARTVNIADTVGYAMPEEFFELISMLRARVPGADRVIFSTHCHDDLGLAVANSLAGIRAGARQVECTANGIGERAGNAALEEIVMALKVRSDILPYCTRVKSEGLAGLSRLIRRATGFPVQYNKAIVGRNAFSHESGIHQDGLLKHVETYEIMRPETVGMPQTSLVMGKHSGRHAFRKKLEELGCRFDAHSFEVGFHRFKALADRTKHIYDGDIKALFEERGGGFAERTPRVAALLVHIGPFGAQRKTMQLEIDGEKVLTAADDDGVADALCSALEAVASERASLHI